jgi:hypothetical protein
MRKLPSIWVFCVIAVFCVLAVQHSGTAQSTPLNDSTSRVLVEEIRALRRSLADYALGNARLQFAIERCRMQQLVIERLADDHRSLESQFESNEDLLEQSEVSLKNLEEALSVEQPVERKEEIERDKRAIVVNIQSSKQRQRNLQGRIIEVGNSLETEKASLREFQSELDQLVQTSTQKLEQ